MSEPYLTGPRALNVPPRLVPLGHFFILGDNRAAAMEGYGGGIVSAQSIRGRLTDVGRIKWRLMVGQWLW